MYPKFAALSSLKETYKDCKICGQKLFYPTIEDKKTTYYDRTGKCSDHYAILFRKYEYGGTWFRPTQEILKFDRFIITIGHRYWMSKAVKVRICLVTDYCISRRNFGDQYAYLTEKEIEWEKTYSLAKFKKLFKFQDSKMFLEKLQALQKAMVLT